MTRLVGLGAGGHARVVLDILALRGGWETICLLDNDRSLRGSVIGGAEVVGDDDLLPTLVASGFTHAFIGVGSSSDLRTRRRVYLVARDAGLEVIDAVHPTAAISASALIGHGATVGAQAVIGPEARIGENVIVNTGAVVEHGCTLGDHVHVATGAVLGGDVTVGSGTHIGLGAHLLQSVHVGADTVVGAGAVVVRDVGDAVVVAGTPARLLRRLGDET